MAIYEETPEDVAASLRGKDHIASGNALYGKVQERPGWGFKAYQVSQRCLAGSCARDSKDFWI